MILRDNLIICQIYNQFQIFCLNLVVYLRVPQCLLCSEPCVLIKPLRVYLCDGGGTDRHFCHNMISKVVFQ